MSASEITLQGNQSEDTPNKNYLLDVLNYPFTRSGFPILLVGAILVLISNYVTYLTVVGLALWALIMVYLSALYHELISLSATDQEELYCFPDLSDFLEDIVLPALKVFGVIFISFAPLIAWKIWGALSMPYGDLIRLSCLAWAALYLPMAMLATVVHGTLLAASPHVVLPAIFRAGPLYLVTAGLIFGLACAEAFSVHILVGPVWLAQGAAAFIVIYVLMSSARALGLFFVIKEDKLRWFYQREDRLEESNSEDQTTTQQG